MFINVCVIGGDAFSGGVSQSLTPLLDAVTKSDSDGVLRDRRGHPGGAERLRKYMQTNWKNVVALFGTEITEGRVEAKLIAAAESMNATEYLEFLNCVRELYLSGKVKKQLLWIALSEANEKSGFLGFNYADPRVQEFIKSVQPIFKDPSDEIVRYHLRSILSGDERRLVLDRFAEDGISLPNGIFLNQPALSPNPKKGLIKPTTEPNTP